LTIKLTLRSEPRSQLHPNCRAPLIPQQGFQVNILFARIPPQIRLLRNEPNSKPGGAAAKYWFLSSVATCSCPSIHYSIVKELLLLAFQRSKPCSDQALPFPNGRNQHSACGASISAFRVGS